MAFIEEDNLVIYYYLNRFEILPYKWKTTVQQCIIHIIEQESLKQCEPVIELK